MCRERFLKLQSRVWTSASFSCLRSKSRLRNREYESRKYENGRKRPEGGSWNPAPTLSFWVKP